MKRVVILLAFLLIMTPLVAYADLIVEPENDFYRQHQSRIIYLGRSFVANGEGGSVPIKKEPSAKSEVANLQNGEVTYMQYSCLFDGDFWGFTTYVGDKAGGKSGWVKLSQMLVLYDYVAFEEDHFDELYLYNGDYAAIKETRAAIAWPWPGSDAPLWTIEDLNMENFRVAYAYRDAEDREWGFVTYLYGSRNIWLCLSDPLNRDMPVFNPAPEPGEWESETFHIDIRQYIDEQENESSIIVIIVVLVIALVTGTAILIRVAWKPNKTESGGKRDD